MLSDLHKKSTFTRTPAEDDATLDHKHIADAHTPGREVGGINELYPPPLSTSVLLFSITNSLFMCSYWETNRLLQQQQIRHFNQAKKLDGDDVIHATHHDYPKNCMQLLPSSSTRVFFFGYLEQWLLCI